VDIGCSLERLGFGLFMSADAKLRRTAMIVAGIGLLDALYLSYVKIINSQVYCGTSEQCDIVNNSSYSEIGGIPIAYLGLGAYLVILALLLLERRSPFWKENSPLALFGISLAGVIYSAYLTYIEIAVLHAICPYCVVSAIAMLFLFIIAIFRLVQVQTGTKPIPSRGG
jgi:uncharacterized membrane protein